MIDWNDPKAKISQYFTVHEATYLPSWQIHHKPSEYEKEEILKTAQVMDKIREYIGEPIHVNCWIRPTSVNNFDSVYHNKNYNSAIGGATHSAHIEGKAVDFTVSKHTASNVRFLLQDKLEEFQIRMENINGNWTHIDTREVPKGGKRFFKP